MLIASEREAKFLADLGGDLLLDLEDVRELALVLLPPELRAAGNIHQLCSYHENFSALKHSSGEHGANTQIATDLDRIHVTFMAKDGTSGYNPQSGELRETIDDRFRDSVAEVL